MGILVQQRSSISNINNQFLTITDTDRQEIIRQVNADFTLKASSWKKDLNDKWQRDAVRVFGTCQNTALHIDVQNMTNFRDYFLSNIVKEHLTLRQDSRMLAELFNAPLAHLNPNYNKLEVQYIILSEMNNIITQTANFYNLSPNTLKLKGWDYESFDAVKAIKNANVAPQVTPQAKGPMDRFAKSGVAMVSSSAPKKTKTPTSPNNSIKKLFARKTPKTALATSNDSDNNLSSQSSESLGAPTSSNKPIKVALAPIPAAIPVISSAAEASTSLKDPRNQPAAAALLMVNPGQHQNNVSIAVASSSSTALATHQMSTPKRDTTVSFNIDANGTITPISLTRRLSTNTPPKRKTRDAGLDNGDSPYKAPRTKENQYTR